MKILRKYYCMIFETFPILLTERFRLIEINKSHLEDIYALYSDEQVLKYFDISPLNNLDDAQKEIDFYRNRFINKEGIRWGITLKNSSELIGTLGFNKIINKHKGRIGYDLKPEYWGKGCMAEALEAIINYGVISFELKRIEAEVMLGNTASEKLLAKLQFKKEGVLKNWMFWNDSYYDITMFSYIVD